MSLRALFKKLLLLAAVLPAAVLLYAGISWVQSQQNGTAMRPAYRGADASGVVRSIFAKEYPQSTKFQSEMELLNSTNRLDPVNHDLIEKLIRTTSSELTMPPGLLWCLLFQESRFDHLTGMNESHKAKGMGQFAYFSFHEVNHNLSRFTDENLKMFITVLGWDNRPIAPLRDTLNAPSSYYYIPTAVTASAAFLNNRYHQLRNVLEKNKISYSPDLLWMYSAMAYNKGTRSVLSYWNKSMKRGGRKEMQRLVLEPTHFFDALDHPDGFSQSLAHIWPQETANKYAEELTRHMKQIKECSIDPELAKSLEAATSAKAKRAVSK